MKSGLIAINLAAIIFGTAALFGELHVSPFWIVGCRAGFASLALIIVGMVRGELHPRSTAKDWRLFLLTGVLLTTHWLTFFASVQLAGIPIATLTFASFPLFTVIIETFRSKRKPHWYEVASGIAIIIAVSLLVDLHAEGTAMWGLVSGFASAITFAIFGIQAKHLTAKYTSLTVSFVQNVIVCLCMLPLMPFAEPKPESLQTVGWLVILGVVTTALMHQLYLFALTKLSASTCSAFIALEPVYAVLFAALLFNQPLTGWIALSGVLIVGASIVLLRSEAKETQAAPVID
ncbi:DMT family transporter [Bdellovibrio sp. HCB274]|uniref:DMT family transporter n=1 Tax=Bdellovibrio sp. HCB274 TaxID=3394361 RepID=UPI0039B65404